MLNRNQSIHVFSVSIQSEHVRAAIELNVKMSTYAININKILIIRYAERKFQAASVLFHKQNTDLDSDVRLATFY